MKAWWRAVGWGILATGLGLGVLGLTGTGDPLAETDGALRQGLLRAGMKWRLGEGWQWREQVGDDDGVWHWQGHNPQAGSRVPVHYVGFDRSREVALGDPTMGPLDLAALLQELRGTGAKAIVFGSWPTEWEESGGVTLRALEDEIQHHPGLIAAAELGHAGEVLEEERRGLAMMAALPTPPEELDLPLVDAARVGWPVQEPPLVLWAGVPGLGLAEAELDGAVARVPLLVTDGQRILPTLPLAVALEVLAIGVEDLHWDEGRVLVGGERLRVRVDEQGRLAVPAEAGVMPLTGWQALPWHQLLELGGETGPDAIAEMTAALADDEEGGEVEIVAEEPVWPLAASPLLGEVLWLERGHPPLADGTAGAGELRARALGVLLNPGWRALEFGLRANRLVSAASAAGLALLLAGSPIGRRSTEIGLVLACVAALLLLAYLGIFLAGWWFSPLPGLVVLAVGAGVREWVRRRSAVSAPAVDVPSEGAETRG